MNIKEFETGRVSRILDGFLIVGDYIRSLPNRYVQYNARRMDENRAFYIKNHSDFERMQRHSIYYIG
jgi:hypothetical protein